MKYLLALALGCAVSGCHLLSETPAIKDATITPKILHPGDTAVLRVQMRDRYHIVERLEGRVIEEPARALRLKDDGNPPDETADDNCYTLQVDVPKEAPSGSFTVEITAYRHDGEPIHIHDRHEKRRVLQTTLPVTIAPAAGTAPAANAAKAAPAPAAAAATPEKDKPAPTSVAPAAAAAPK